MNAATATRLLLWRHGQTTWNADRRVQGHTDVPLDETGRRQAGAAAARLAPLGADVIVSSDLSRAADTAAALAKITGREVCHDPRLRERAYGEWQGLTMDEIARRWPAGYARWRAGAAVDEAGVESQDDFGKRVGAALREISERHSGRTVVVVTHGGTVRRAITVLLDWPPLMLRGIGTMHNCHWSELAYRGERGWQLRAYNVGFSE